MAYKNSGPKKDFQFVIDREYRRLMNDKGDGGTLFCVGHWVIDGKAMRPKIEFRDFWNEENGIKVGKARAWGSVEVELYLKNSKDINALIGLPDQIVAECLAEAEKTPEAVPVGAAGEPF